MRRSLLLLTDLGDACLLTGDQSSSDRQRPGSMGHAAVAAERKEDVYGDDDRRVGA